MNVRRIFVVSALLLLTASQVSTAQSMAFERAATLNHGLNLSGWFASSRDLSPQHIANFTNATDLKAIHQMGFDFVRLGVDPSLIERHGEAGPANPEALTELDHAVAEALANHLEVMLCVFPNDDFKHNLDNESGVDDFVQLWRILATHFAAQDHARIFFELMNEPEVRDPYRWMGIQARADEAIRQIDPYHTVIATAANYSNPPDPLQLAPLRHPNVIYNFHFYDQHEFTHQGASWGADNWIFYKNIPYPATAAQSAREAR